MRTPIALSCLFFTCSFLFCQPVQWINYATGWTTDNVALEGDNIWIPTTAGLVNVNKITGEQEAFYQPWNSPLVGPYINGVTLGIDNTKWIATDDGGLCSFDGSNNWEHFYIVNTGDTLTKIEAVKVADNGDVWFISRRHEGYSDCNRFFQYNGSTFKRHDQHFESVSWQQDCTIHMIDFDFNSSNELWVANWFNVALYDGIDQVLLHFDSLNSPLLSTERIYKMAVDDSDQLWLGTGFSFNSENYYRILKYDGSEWTVEIDQTLGACWNMFSDHAGNFWFELGPNDNKDYVRYTDPVWTFWKISDLPIAPFLWDSYDPTLLQVDSMDNWWFAGFFESYEPRVFMVDGSSWTDYSPEILPLPAYSFFNEMLFDCYNNTWLASDTKLCKRENGNWITYEPPIDGGDIRSLTLDETTCDLWFTSYESNGNDIIKFDGISFEGIEVPGSVFQVTVNNGIIWATGSEGLGKFENGSWTWFDESNSLLIPQVYRISFDPSGNLWITDSQDGLLRFDGLSTWQLFNSSNSPIGDAYWTFVDHSGMLWVNSFSGLYKFNGLDWQEMLIPPGLDYPTWISAIAEDANHDFWFATYRGLFHWDGLNFTSYDQHNSDLLRRNVDDVKVDAYGNKWMRHVCGISVYNESFINNRFIPQAPSAHGTLFFDDNQNGVYDVNQDIPLAGKKVLLLPDSVQSFSNIGGYYSFYPEPGNYQVQYIPAVPFNPTSPSTLNFELDNDVVTDLNFGVWTTELADSIDIGIIVGPTICSQHMTVWITLTNHGLEPVSGNVVSTFDNAFNFISDYPAAGILSGNTVSWTYDNLPFNGSNVFRLELSVPGVDFLEEWFSFDVMADAVENSQVIASTTDNISSQVVCSYDPNDKISHSVGPSMFLYSLLDDPLDYTIRFQNEGSYLAFDIVIKDTLDPFLDASTLQVLSSSHNVSTLLEPGGIVTFSFEGIDLPPTEQDYLGSQGYVKFRIAPRPNLPDPTTILNTAYIYFDFNPAIATNTSENILVETFPVSAVSTNKKAAVVAIYPNPTNSDIWIEWPYEERETTKWKVTFFDLSGKIIHAEASTLAKHKIPNLEQGFFMIKIEKDQMVITKKIVVIK